MPTRPSNADLFCALMAALVLTFCLCWAGWAVYLYTRPRRPRNEYRAIGSLRVIHNAQDLFREGDKDGDEVLDFAANLGELLDTGPSGQEDLIGEDLAKGTKDWYRFRIARLHPQFVWVAWADPTEAKWGNRYYGINQDGEIFSSEDGPIRFNADGSSPDTPLE